ncbi:hypothetical protein TvY486_0034170, partial [Trypanosoma vivax Y486]
MQWKCKSCSYTSEKRAQLFKHYRISHGAYSRIAPVPCLHTECPCTLKSFNALKVHLSKNHSQQRSAQSSNSSHALVSYKCHVCDFKEPCSESEYFAHLRTHLRNSEKVQCPFKDCSFETNVYSTFNAHKSKAHQQHCHEDFKLGVMLSTAFGDTQENIVYSLNDNSGSEDECNMAEEQVNLEDTKQKLEHSLASLFLKMRTILHISENATQEIIQQLNQIHLLSEPLLYNIIQQTVEKHYDKVDSTVVKKLVRAVTESNVLLHCTNEGGPLSTSNKRASYFMREYSVVSPVEYKVDRDEQYYVVYPNYPKVAKLLNKPKVLDEVLAFREK